MVGSDPVRDLEFSPDAHVLAVLSPAALFFSAWAAACSLARAPARMPVIEVFLVARVRRIRV